MNEIPPNDRENLEAIISVKRREMADLAKRLSERAEGFPFPGIRMEELKKIRANDEEFPGYSTPIDEIVSRCQREGVKVVLGDDPESGVAHILPLNSNSLDDTLSPRQLEISPDMDEDLKHLIELQIEFRRLDRLYNP